MTRLIFIFILATLKLFAENKEHYFQTEVQVSSSSQFLQDGTTHLSAYEGLPNSIVHGHVDVITGHFFDAQTDLDLGSFSLTLERSFSSHNHARGSIAHGWDHSQSLVLQTESHARHRYAVSKGKLGGEFLYRGAIDGTKLTLDQKNFEKGVTNCGALAISAKTNVRNNFLKKLGGGEYELKTCTNALIKFEKLPRCKLYHIASQKLPNGNTIDYQQDLNEFRTWKVTKKNSIGNDIGVLKFSFPLKDEIKFYAKNKKKGAARPEIRITAPDGRRVKYTLDVFCGGRLPNSKEGEIDYYRARVVEVSRPNAPSETYHYNEPYAYGLEQMVRKEGPDGRFLAVDYNCGRTKFEHGKVKCLKIPNGTESDPTTLYSFFYEENKDHQAKTVVTDGLGHRTIYYYSSKSNLLNAIERFNGNSPYSLHSRESFEWGTGDEMGNLLSRKITGPEDNLCFEKSYRYDKNGNVLESHTLGSFTGQQELEDSVKAFTYSKDGRNLVLSMREGPLKESYGYEPNRELLTSKIVSAKNSPLKKREFFKYDENGAIVLKIVDDGTSQSKDDLTGITQRSITRFVNRKTAPVGLPEICEELYFDLATNQEQLLKKTTYEYDNLGNLTNEKTFDANGQYCFENTFTYNRFGQVLSEVNAEGITTTYQYDKNGNQTLKTCGKITTLYSYDLNNRCIKSEIQDGSNSFVETFQYDVMGNKIASCDISGNETKHHYDALGHLCQTTYCDNESSLKEFFEYDIFGNICLKVDPAGYRTSALPNLRGQPLKIEHPDGSIETFEYSLNGELLSHTTPEKITKVTYDSFSRPLIEEVYSHEGVCLSKKQKFYSAFHLIKEIDTDGLISEYFYDGAGRLVKSIKGDFLEEYSYDSLGRKCEERSENSTKKYRYDFLDRLTEESTHYLGELQTKTCYGYDEADNCIQIVKESMNGACITSFEYDGLNRMIKKTNSLNLVERVFFEHYPENKKTVVSPNGNQTVYFYNALNQEREIQEKNAFGKVLKKLLFDYDENGNCTSKVEHVYSGDHFLHDHQTSFSYDCMNRLVKTIEAASTSFSKTVTRCYDKAGRLCLLTKADGVYLTYRYDSLNRLVEYFSSDNTIHYQLFYNAANAVIKAKDLSNGTTTFKEYDANRHLVSETLANGLTLKFERDCNDRILKLTYPDESVVKYSYEGLRLKKVEKHSNKGELQYSHTYDNYDLSGNLIDETLIGNVGKIHYSYDKLNRPIQIQAPHFEEDQNVFDENGNLVSRTMQNISCQYRYDELDQLAEEKGECTNSFTNDSRYNQLVVNGVKREFNLADEFQENVYDQNGNIIQNGIFDYEYDALDRLTAVKTQERTLRYFYDAFHRRIKKSSNTTEKYFYLGDDELGSIGYNGSTLASRVLGRQSTPGLAKAVAIEIDGRLFAPIHDSQGNVRVLIDKESSEVAEAITYSAYGQEQNTSTLSPWRLASKRKDFETGLVYFGARDYNPAQMTWTTLDPVLSSIGQNRHSYLQNNPFRYVDPDGRLVFTLPLIIWGVEGVAVALTGTQILQIAAASAAAYYCGHEASKLAAREPMAVAFGLSSYLIQLMMEGTIDEPIEGDSGSDTKEVKEIFPGTPQDLKNDPDWEDVTHPDNKTGKHKNFENKKTGEKVRFDKGEPGEDGFKGKDHYHRLNPNNDKKSIYVDKYGNPCRKNSSESHLEPPKGIKWDF